MKKRYLCVPLFAFLSLSYFDIPNKVIGCEQNYAPNIETVEEKPMVVVIASYNNKKYYKHNLDSVFSQKYTNFRVIYTSDASTDGTADLVREYVKERGFEDKFTLIDNKENKGACYNCYTMIHTLKKDEIVCILDGDDALANNGVLSRLNRAYVDDRVWMTYGGLQEKEVEKETLLKTNPKQGVYKFIEKYGEGAISKVMLRNRCHRLVSLRFHHLRTFYAGVFQTIPVENFLKDGEFYKMAWDVALVLSLIDRAGDHTYYISDSMYEYNMDNPLNEFRISQVKQNLKGLSIYFRKKIESLSSSKDFL